MGEQTGIAWTKSTFNPWIGCTRVSPACDNCYAEVQMSKWLKVVQWGAGEARKRTRPANWNKPLQWNAEAPTSEFAGIKGFWPVFCSSLADVFDNEVDPGWREDLWALIRATPNLTWQLLTKRIGNVEKMLPADWADGYRNVWLGATIANQEELNRDGVKLLMLPARERFFSIEPMLGFIDLERSMLSDQTSFDALRGGRFARAGELHDLPGISWVICGGESGDHARPLHPEWAISLRDQCTTAGVPYFFKQWGAWRPISQGVGNWYSDVYKSRVKAKQNQDQAVLDDIHGRICAVQTRVAHRDGSTHDIADIGAFPPNAGAVQVFNVGAKVAGNVLDDTVWQQFPAVPA